MGVLNPFMKDLIEKTKKNEQNVAHKGSTEPENEKGNSRGSGKKGDNSEKQGKGQQKEANVKEEAKNDESQEQQNQNKKGKGDNKKDKEHEHSEHGKNKAHHMKVVTRENQKNPNPNQPASKSSEQDESLQLIEKGIEKKFNDIIDKIPRLLTTQFNKIEDIIEAKVNERVAKMNMETINATITGEIDKKLQKEFSHAFEKTVTPCFERYLSKMFEQVCASYEKGHKFYIDKLNIEQAGGAQIQKTMNEVVKSFVQISNSLTEGYVNQQNTFQKLETEMNDKQDQVTKLLEKMNEIIQKQEELQEKLEYLEKGAEKGEFREPGTKNFSNFNQAYHNDPTQQKHSDKKAPPMVYGMFNPNNPYYEHGKGDKEKVQHPLNDQLAYLQALMSGKPMDLSGGNLPRGPPISVPGMTNPNVNQNYPPSTQGQPDYDQSEAAKRKDATLNHVSEMIKANVVLNVVNYIYSRSNTFNLEEILDFITCLCQISE